MFPARCLSSCRLLLLGEAPECLTPTMEEVREWVLPPLQLPRAVTTPPPPATNQGTHRVPREGTQRLLSARPGNPTCNGGAFHTVVFQAEILTGTNNQ